LDGVQIKHNTMSSKNNSPEQKKQWKETQKRHIGFPLALPSGSKAFPFWSWRNASGLVNLPAKVRGAFGRPKAPRKNAGSFGVRCLQKHWQTSEPRKLELVAKLADSAKQVYGRLTNGSLLKLSPRKPWSGKSERRQVLQNRREDRALAAANA
jgi:hypothetical protein